MKELSPYFVRRIDSPSEGKPVALLNEPVEEEITEPSFWDLWNIWRIVKKRKALIATVFLAVVITVAVVTYRMPPIYTSAATLLIEQREPQVLNIQRILPVSPEYGSYDYYQTQYALLRSPSLAAEVIRQLGLENNKVFTGENKKGLAAELKSLVKNWIAIPAWLKSKNSSAKENARDPTATETMLTNIYISKYLEIVPVGRTQMVQVAFNTPDPNLSAQLANAHAQAYLRQSVKFRDSASQEAQTFLEQKLTELKDRTEKSEALLKDYRKDKGIISGDDKNNIVVERLGDLNRRLTAAEAERIKLEVQVRLIRQKSFDAVPTVINSPLIQALKSQAAGLEAEYAKLAAEFNISYPPLAQVNAQLEEVRKRLGKELQSVATGIESDYLAAEAREKALRDKVREQRSAALNLKDAAVEYAILSREADTNRQLYDSVAKRITEIGITGELHMSNIYIVDEAKPPLGPSRPKKMPYLYAGVFMGAMLGVALAFLLEYLDKSVKTPDEVKRYANLPTLGIVPDFSIAGKAGEPSLVDMIEESGATKDVDSHNNASVAARRPRSLVWESYCTLQTSILLSQAEEPPKVVLFTSGLGGEGKTATVINTAIIFAQMEARVLVIDADLRRPSCHNRLWQERGSGLTELLTGQRTLEEVIKPTLTDNLFVITGGAVPPDPVKLVGSRKMHEVLTRLREQFDYIFIDSPPVIAVSDSIRLSTMVDGVVVVVKGQDTTRNVLQEACFRLRYARAKILGVVLNKVDLKNSHYDYYHLDYYRDVNVPEATV
jgi:polysaccharide biosynthesis transport protein